MDRPQMSVNQINDMREKSYPILGGLAVRQTEGGYIINGVINWLDKETNVLTAQQQDECLALSFDDVLMRIANYNEYYTFKLTSPSQSKVAN